MRGDYSYPADEFDAAASGPRPVGAHRAARSRWRRVLPFLVVLLVFPLLAYGIVMWLVNADALPSVVGGPAATGGAATQTPATEDGDADSDAEGDAAAPAGPEQASDDVATDTEPQPSPAPEADLTRPVVVYNATNRTGLAAGAAAEVADAGFTAVTTGNWSAQDPPGSVVRYADEADLGTAQAVASALGIATVEASGDADGVVVVLTDDYPA